MVYLRVIVKFLSALWTFILTAPIHCRGSIGEPNATFLKICSDEENKNYILDGSHQHHGWPEGKFSAIFHFL